jgi:hypothetical protein
VLLTVPPRTPLGQVIRPLTKPVGLDAIAVAVGLDLFCGAPPDPPATDAVWGRAEQVGQPAGRVHSVSLIVGEDAVFTVPPPQQLPAARS